MVNEPQSAFSSLPASPGRQRQARRIFFAVIGTALVLAVAALSYATVHYGSDPRAWITADGRCRYQSRTFVAALRPLIDEWDDANRLANQTSRIALPPQIARLQEIRRNTAELPAPACMQDVRTLATDYMDATIDAYLAFISRDPDSVVAAAFARAQSQQEAFILRYATVQQ